MSRESTPYIHGDLLQLLETSASSVPQNLSKHIFRVNKLSLVIAIEFLITSKSSSTKMALGETASVPATRNKIRIETYCNVSCFPSSSNIKTTVKGLTRFNANTNTFSDKIA